VRNGPADKLVDTARIWISPSVTVEAMKEFVGEVFWSALTCQWLLVGGDKSPHFKEELAANHRPEFCRSIIPLRIHLTWRGGG